MTHAEICDQIQSFMTRELLDPGLSIEPTTQLIELGLIDSLSAVVLVTFITTSFEIEVGLEELTEANLQTITAMAEMVLRLRQSSSVAA